MIISIDVGRVIVWTLIVIFGLNSIELLARLACGRYERSNYTPGTCIGLIIWYGILAVLLYLFVL